MSVYAGTGATARNSAQRYSEATERPEAASGGRFDYHLVKAIDPISSRGCSAKRSRVGSAGLGRRQDRCGPNAQLPFGARPEGDTALDQRAVIQENAMNETGNVAVWRDYET